MSLMISASHISPSSTPMTVGTSIARGRKRKRSPENDSATERTPPPEPLWKRAGFQSAEQATTAFWDNLPKVPLCPSALREFDRRNWPPWEPSSESISRSTNPTTSSITRRAIQAIQLGESSTIFEDSAAQLKGFARRGGLNLHDLRGV